MNTGLTELEAGFMSDSHGLVDVAAGHTVRNSAAHTVRNSAAHTVRNSAAHTVRNSAIS